jgi:branched-chain amino acid transport system permease protein
MGIAFVPNVFNIAFYYVLLSAFLLCVGVMWRIVNSPFGDVRHASQENETRAAFIGKRVRRCCWYAFILSGGFTGLADGLLGQVSKQVTPEQLPGLWSAKLVLATVLGGTRQFLGPVVGAFVFVII